MQKLRRKEGGPAAGNANGGGEGPVPETPKKKRGPAAKKAGVLPGRKRGKAAKLEDDSEEEAKIPTKKVKVEKEIPNPLE